MQTTSLPVGHPPVHEHLGGTCPASDEAHGWCRVSTDSRSPCPALNALANHGYLPRNGENIGVFSLYNALKAGYNISTLFAGILAIGTSLIYGRRFSLHDLSNHKKAEHNASLVHADTPEGREYAPNEVQKGMLERLIDDCQPRTDEDLGAGEGEERNLLDETAAARARIRREKESPHLDGIRAEIAVGEMALVLGILGTKIGDRTGVPVGWIREFMGEERFPTGWKPNRVMGLLDAGRNARAIKAAMAEQRKAV